MSKRRVLFVDDEKGIRDTMALILSASGYEVTTAEHGFDALLQMSGPVLPELVISDLNMPQMSGFELLSVIRRRFPQIPVIASSGAYDTGDAVPGGVIADAFHAKSGDGPVRLLNLVAELFSTFAERTIKDQSKSAPVWIPRNGSDSKGVPFIVLTCTQCLRSFPLSVEQEAQGVRETACLFCPNSVRYIVDFSRDVNPSGAPDALQEQTSANALSAKA